MNKQQLASKIWESANKMRSLLTMLGVIIGVAAVIALVSVGMGVRTGITSNFESLGANTITIMPGSSNRGGPRGAAGSMQTLKYDDAKAIEAKIKDIQYVSPTVSSSYQVVNGNQNWNTSVTGVTPDLMQIRSLTVDNGSFISKEDMTKRNRVAVIGATVAENLFGTENPVGKNIRINNVLPGWIDSLPGTEERRESVPMKRYGTMEEIAATIAFLASEGAGYITGQNILADGGAYPGML